MFQPENFQHGEIAEILGRLSYLTDINKKVLFCESGYRTISFVCLSLYFDNFFARKTVGCRETPRDGLFPSLSLSELPKLYPIMTNGIFITCNTLDFSDHDPVYDKLMIRINGSNGFNISTHFLR